MAETRWRLAVKAQVGFVLAVLVLATLLSAGGRWSWFCDLFTHFRPQLTAGFALAGVAALWLRQRGLTIVAAAGLLMNLIFMAPVVWAGPQPDLADGRPVRVVSFNVAFFNHSFAEIGPYLESLQADVVALQELPLRDLPQVLAQLPGYPHHFLGANTGDYGVVVVSRWPLTDTHVIALGVPGRDAAQVSLALPDGRLTLTAVHLLWPLKSEAAFQRNTQLAALAPVLAQCRGACVVVGDFNVTRWSTHFQDLLRDAGMRDCARGWFVPQTWPSWRVPLRIRIDQCLVNDGVEVLGVATGPAHGSDHLSTINDLRIARIARRGG